MKKLDPQSAVAQLVGGARGRLLETVATVGRPYSVRQLAERAGVDHTNASDLLREFQGLGLVRSEPIGSSIAYEPVIDNVLLGMLHKMRLLQSEIVEALAVRATLAPPGVTLAVFGSVAAERASQGSDLDLLVITDTGDTETQGWADEYIRYAGRASGLDVNPLRFSREDWKEAQREGALIVDTVRSRHRLLCGEL